MKLAIPISDFQHILGAQLEGEYTSSDLIQEVIYDTRKIIRTSGVAFFALNGPKQSGHPYIQKAYELGVRYFVVEKLPLENYPAAVFLKVTDTLKALQKLAKSRREHIKYPIVAIAG